MAATRRVGAPQPPVAELALLGGANQLLPALSGSCSASASGAPRQRDNVALLLVIAASSATQRQPRRMRRHAAAGRSALPLLPAAPPLFPPGKWYDASLRGLASRLADGASPSLVL
jgi:hypothetical protein